MRNQAFFAFFSQLAAIGAIASSGCGDSVGPSGLSSNPQDWPVPPRCESRVCEVEAEVWNMCTQYSEWDWAERIGEPCKSDVQHCTVDTDVCEACVGTYICEIDDCDPFDSPTGCDPNSDKRKPPDPSSMYYGEWYPDCACFNDETSKEAIASREAVERFCACLKEDDLLETYSNLNERHCLYQYKMLAWLYIRSRMPDCPEITDACIINAANCAETRACLIEPGQSSIRRADNPDDCENICRQKHGGLPDTPQSARDVWDCRRSCCEMRAMEMGK